MKTVCKGMIAAALAAACLAGTAVGQVITQWKFNSLVPDATLGTGNAVPSTGAGTVALFGGTTTTFQLGSDRDPDAAAGDNSAYNTTTYPAQGAGSGTRGVQYNVSTAGASNIWVYYDQQNSGTASKFWVFQYTTDGVAWTSAGLPGAGIYAAAPGFTAGPPPATNAEGRRQWDLSGIAAVNNNPLFGFRILSVFDPSNPGLYTVTSGTAAYNSTGTARWDMVTVSSGELSAACCTGAVCTFVLNSTCVSLGQFYTFFASCAPNPCPTEVPVQPGDLAYGAGITSNRDAVQQVRGATLPPAGPTRVGTWGKFQFIQSMQFDNAGGGVHAPDGNLLGLDFGGFTTGAVLHNLSTNGTAQGEVVYRFDGTTFGIPLSRAAGIAVSPDNQYIAVGLTDATRIAILKYSAGATPGTGAGATITGGQVTDPITFQIGTNSPGVTWISSTRLAAFVNNLNLFGPEPAGATIWSMDYNAGTMSFDPPVFRLATNDAPNFSTSRFQSLAYVPSISPHVYAASSSFDTPSATSITKISAVDAAIAIELVSLNLSSSSNTGRQLAVGPDRHLYWSQFAGSGTTAASPIFDRINLDANADNAVTAADTALYTDNSSTDFYLKGGAVTVSFNGMDVAVKAGTGLCCAGAICVENQTAAQCSALQATAQFVPNSLAGCPVLPITTAYLQVPCCRANFNHQGLTTPQDIFDFLAAYFANKPIANINGGALSPQDIFDYLKAYFLSPACQ